MLPLMRTNKRESIMLSTSPRVLFPYKSLAVGLLFSVILGPLGLLYSSFWGGIILLPFAIFFLCNQLYFLAILIWIACCILSVRAIEQYNCQLMQVIISQ